VQDAGSGLACVSRCGAVTRCTRSGRLPAESDRHSASGRLWACARVPWVVFWRAAPATVCSRGSRASLSYRTNCQTALRPSPPSTPAAATRCASLVCPWWSQNSTQRNINSSSARLVHRRFFPLALGWPPIFFMLGSSVGAAVVGGGAVSCAWCGVVLVFSGGRVGWREHQLETQHTPTGVSCRESASCLQLQPRLLLPPRAHH
jgi:hypothetical protein